MDAWPQIRPRKIPPRLSSNQFAILFQQLSPKPHARVVVVMGSASDTAHCEKIKQACRSSGVPCELRVSSAHKGTDETLKILAEYEGMFCLNWCVVSNGKVRDGLMF